MSQKTKIEWCDSTFNPWIGCTKVGPGCDHCYAETMNARFKGGNWGSGAQRKRTAESNWQNAIMWNKKAASGLFVECAECGKREFRKWDNTVPPGGLSFCSNPDCVSLPESDSFTARPRVFCASMADWLDNEVPIEWLADLLNLIRITPHLDWLLLTKRIGNWRSRMEQVAGYSGNLGEKEGYEKWSDTWSMAFDWLKGAPPKNIWMGATICNQTEANRDIEKLLKIPASVRFLSVEPLLDEINLTHLRGSPIDYPEAPKRAHWINALTGEHGCYLGDSRTVRSDLLHKVDWVIVGGESGPGARPMHPDWVRSLRDQCISASTPFFFKQWGEWLAGELTPGKTTYARCDTGEVMKSNGRSTRDNFMTHPDKHSGNLIALKIGKKNSGRLLDGVEWNQFPKAGT